MISLVVYSYIKQLVTIEIYMKNSQNILNTKSAQYYSWLKKLFQDDNTSKVPKEKLELYNSFIDIIVKQIETQHGNKIIQRNQHILKLNYFYKKYIILVPNGSINNYFEYLSNLTIEITNNQEIHLCKMITITSELHKELNLPQQYFNTSKKKLTSTLQKVKPEH
jgi:hypothetical protein